MNIGSIDHPFNCLNYIYIYREASLEGASRLSMGISIQILSTCQHYLLGSMCLLPAGELDPILPLLPRL